MRFVILALSTLCLTLGMCGTVVLHLTVICMRQETTLLNGTVLSTPLFTFAEEGRLFSALYLGTLLGTFPISHLCNWMGFRRAFTVYGILNGVGTVVVPLAARFLAQPFDFMAIFGARFIQGLFLSMSLVAIETISKNWSTLKEMTFFMSILSINFQFGRIITMPLSGYIQSGKADVAKKNGSEKGFKFLTNWHVLTVFAVGIGIANGAHLFSLYGPIYLHNSIGLNMQRTGLIVALPFVISSIMSLIVGRLSDRLNVGIKPVLALLTCFSQYVMAIGYVILALITPSSPFLIQIVYVVIMSVVGLCTVGLVKQARWADSEHAQSINSINTAIIHVFVMLIPEFVTLIIPNPDDPKGKGWNTLFIVVAIVQTLSALLSQVSIIMRK
uniref:MFS domain-containing protein n=1 Tax=Globodera pallida TaxID=36090 RepID=A0A183C7U9_GLOPA